MSNIAVLHGSGDACQRLRRAVATDSAAGAKHTLKQYRDWETFLDDLRRDSSNPLSIAILDAYDSGHFDIERIQHLRREFPNLPVIAYSEFQSRPAQEAVMLAVAGVSRLITLGIDDHPYQIREALASVDALSCHVLRVAVTPSIGSDGAELFVDIYKAASEAMCSAGNEGTDEQARTIIPNLRRKLAALVGAGPGRRGLERSLARSNLPAPGKLILLARLLHVGRLLDDPGRSIANVATTTGFDDTLFRVIKRETGLTPDVLRKIGAFKTVLSLVELRLLPKHTSRKPSRAGMLRQLAARKGRSWHGKAGVGAYLSQTATPLSHLVSFPNHLRR